MPTIQPFFDIRRKDKPFFVVEYMNAYVGTRTKLMEDEYKRWLAEQSPTERAKIRVRYAEALAGLESKRHAYAQAYASGNLALAKSLVEGAARTGAAWTAADASLKRQGMVSTQQERKQGMEYALAQQEMQILPPAERAQWDLSGKQFIAEVRAQREGESAEEAAARIGGAAEKFRLGIEDAQANSKNPLALSAVRTILQREMYDAVLDMTTRAGVPAEEAAESANRLVNYAFGNVQAMELNAQTAEEIRAKSPQYGGTAVGGSQAFIEGLQRDAPWIMDLAKEPEGRTSVSTTTTVPRGAPAGTYRVPPPTPEAVENPAPATGVPSEEPDAPSVPGYTAYDDGSGGYYMQPDEYAARALAPAPAYATGAPGGIGLPATLPPGPAEVEITRQMRALDDTAAMEDRLGKNWDDNLGSFFGRAADPRTLDVIRRIGALRKRAETDPQARAAYESMWNKYYGAHPREARRAARPVERALRQVERGEAVEYAPGGAPVSSTTLRASTYGPDFYDDPQMAADALTRDAMAMGYSQDQAADFIQSPAFVGQWEATGWRGQPAPEDERRAYEETVYAPRTPEEARTHLLLEPHSAPGRARGLEQGMARETVSPSDRPADRLPEASQFAEPPAAPWVPAPVEPVPQRQRPPQAEYLDVPGPGGYTYRLYGRDLVEIVGSPRNADITPENPIQVRDPEVRAKIIREITPAVAEAQRAAAGATLISNREAGLAPTLPAPVPSVDTTPAEVEAARKTREAFEASAAAQPDDTAARVAQFAADAKPEPALVPPPKAESDKWAEEYADRVFPMAASPDQAKVRTAEQKAQLERIGAMSAMPSEPASEPEPEEKEPPHLPQKPKRKPKSPEEQWAAVPEIPTTTKPIPSGSVDAPPAAVADEAQAESATAVAVTPKKKKAKKGEDEEPEEEPAQAAEE